MNLFDTSEQSPVTTPAPERERPGGRTVVLVVLGLGLLLGGGWTAAYLAASDKVPRGTTVAGVAVGGQEPAAAAATLEQGLADQVAAPISVRVGDQTRAGHPGRGRTQRRLRGLGGRRRWPDQLEPGPAVDLLHRRRRPRRRWSPSTTTPWLPRSPRSRRTPAGRPRTALSSSAAARSASPTPWSVAASTPRPARQALEDAFLTDDEVDLSLVDVQPEIDADDVAAVRADFVNPAMSGPVTLLFGKSEVRLRPQQYAAALTVEADDGVLVPGLDPDALDALVQDRTSERGKPVDATVALVGGKPQVDPVEAGGDLRPGRRRGSSSSTSSPRPEGERSARGEGHRRPGGVHAPRTPAS